jgi:hypothetical protein
MEGQKTIPQRLAGKTLGDNRVGLRSGRRRGVGLRIGEVDGYAARTGILRRVPLGQNGRLDARLQGGGRAGDFRILRASRGQGGAMAQINVGRGHLLAEDAGERLGIAARLRDILLARAL